MSTIHPAGKRIKKWLGFFGLFVFFGVWNLAVIAAQHMIAGESFNWKSNIASEMTAALSGFLLLPALLWFFRVCRIRRRNAWRTVPLHILASVVYAGLFVLLLYGTRSALWALDGSGPYDFGPWTYRFLMEFLKISLMFWGIYALVALSRARRENEDARLRTARLEKMLSAARLQALQRQVHPHFLFNTLNTISSAMYEDVGAADRMIVNLAGLLRLTLDAPADEHPLSREIELVRHYAEIMKARFRDKLALAIDVGPDTEGAMVPAFILQPLVENSIKYGAAATGSADVRIVVRRDGGRFLMTVEDRGPGLGEKGAASGAGGVGLSNIAERLDALYGSEGRLDLRNLAEGGLRATIDIPFRTRDAGEAAR